MCVLRHVVSGTYRRHTDLAHQLVQGEHHTTHDPFRPPPCRRQRFGNEVDPSFPSCTFLKIVSCRNGRQERCCRVHRQVWIATLCWSGNPFRIRVCKGRKGPTIEGESDSICVICLDPLSDDHVHTMDSQVSLQMCHSVDAAGKSHLPYLLERSPRSFTVNSIICSV